MKRFFLIPIIGSLMLASSCKKDDDIEHNTPPEPQPYVPTEVDTNYVLGRYQPTRMLSEMVEEDEAQHFTWGAGETPLLLYMGADNQLRAFEYDGQNRQKRVNIPASSLSGPQTLQYTYNESGLTQLSLIGNSSPLLSATTTCDGNQLKSVHYDNVDENVIMGYINNFLSSQSKDLVENISVSNLQSDYTWTGSNVTSDHLSATGTTDLAVGELVQLLNLDTSFYRMIIETSGLDEQIPGITPQLMQSFVNMLSDSTCHIIIDVDMTTSYTYDGHPNPLYGFWGWGFLGNTRVLSQHNILGSVREGLANLNLSVNLPTEVPDSYDFYTRIALTLALNYLNNQYPDGFHYDYPLDLNKEEHNSYTYDSLGWPASVTDSDGHATTFTYASSH